MTTYRHLQINKILASSGEALIRHGGPPPKGATAYTYDALFDADPLYYLTRTEGCRLVLIDARGEVVRVIDEGHNKETP